MGYIGGDLKKTRSEAPVIDAPYSPFHYLEGKEIYPGLVLSSLIGCGGSGYVYKASEKVGSLTLRERAVKLIRASKENTESHELEVITQFDHPNLIECNAVGSVVLLGEPFWFITMELAECDLLTWLSSRDVEAEQGITILRAVLTGLTYLHGREMVHRDIAPQNVLLVQGIWKVADFGLLKSLSPGHVTGTVIGHNNYMAPEIFRGIREKPADVWAVGIIAAELFSLGRLEFGIDGVKVPPKTPKRIRTMIRRATERNPLKRISAEDALNILLTRPYFRSIGFRSSSRGLGYAVGSVVVAGLVVALLLHSSGENSLNELRIEQRTADPSSLNASPYSPALTEPIDPTCECLRNIPSENSADNSQKKSKDSTSSVSTALDDNSGDEESGTPSVNNHAGENILKIKNTSDIDADVALEHDEISEKIHVASHSSVLVWVGFSQTLHWSIGKGSQLARGDIRVSRKDGQEIILNLQ